MDPLLVTQGVGPGGENKNMFSEISRRKIHLSSPTFFIMGRQRYCMKRKKEKRMNTPCAIVSFSYINFSCMWINLLFSYCTVLLQQTTCI